MDTLTFKCWVYGEDADTVFTVKIANTETVLALKELIKSQEPVGLRGADANSFDLYSFPTPSDEHLEDALRRWYPRVKYNLDPHQLVSNLSPLERFLIIDGPRLLNCWVRGQEVNRIFEVEISEKKIVSDLKELIKSKDTVFRDVDAHTLDLYKVSIPCDENIKNTLDSLTLRPEQLLSGVKALSSYFTNIPLRKHVHIIVEAPLPVRSFPPPPSLPLDDVRAQRLTFLNNSPPMLPPYEGGLTSFAQRQAIPEQTIYCGRPRDTHATIPTTLLHPVFGQFLDDCEAYNDTADESALIVELHTATTTCRDEWAWIEMIRDIFSRWGLPFTPSRMRAQITTDDMSVSGHCYAIADIMNMGDPYVHATLYYLESTRSYATKLSDSPLPCIIMLLFGPFVSFVGATWNLRPVIQPLCHPLPMNYGITDTDMQTRVARHLVAFKKAVRTLEEYYRTILGMNAPVPQLRSRTQAQLFPYPTDFVSLLDGRLLSFQYISQPFQDQLIFFGTLPDERNVCVKFVRGYSKDAHMECVSLGCAPTLHGLETLPGGWFMVVMDRLAREDYVELPNTTPRVSLMSNIRNALETLHERGYVHGDVRDTNILVSKSDENAFMLVGLDWAGKIGEAQYPMNVTRAPDLWRPEGAVNLALIKAEHDMEMLGNIEKCYGIADAVEG